MTSAHTFLSAWLHDSRCPGRAGFFLGLLAGALVLTWLYNGSGGSVAHGRAVACVDQRRHRLAECRRVRGGDCQHARDGLGHRDHVALRLEDAHDTVA
jgi:hypothetical protein